MAATVRSSNTWYTDQTATLSSKNIRVTHIVACGNGGAAVLVVKDPVASGDLLKFDLRVASGTTQVFDFSNNPIVFPNGIKVTTATNVIATFVIRESTG